MTPLRPSIFATSLGLLAMITLLATTNGEAWILVGCIVALLGTHVSMARLDRSSYVPLVVRLLLFPTIFVLSGATSLGIDWIFEPRTLRMLGQIAAIELVLRHWKHVSSPETGRFPIASLLLSSLVYLAAANIYFLGSYIQLITPLFMGVLCCALLDWRPAPMRRSAWALTVACWSVGIFGGWGLHTVSMAFKNELMGLGSQLLRESGARVAGTSDRPQMQSRFNIEDSPRRVLRVEGDLVDPHLRVASFDFYDGSSWGPSLLDSQNRNINGNFAESRLRPNLAKAGGRATSVRITRLVEMQNDPVLAPLNMLGLRAVDHADPEGPIYDFEAFSGLMRCTEPNPFTYEVSESGRNIAGIPTLQGPLTGGGVALSKSDSDKYLRLPPGFDPRVKAIANEVTLNDDVPAARVESLARYLLLNHRYSSTIQLDRRRGPISQFILDKKDAHCEFFAAALALMCREVGVPSRYVVGYLAHETALGEPGVINVRQRDAHAWAEVWIDGVGWVTADATPSEGRPEGRQQEARSKVSILQKWGEWASDFVTGIRNRAVKIPRSTWAWIIGVPLALWIIVRGRPEARRRKARDDRGYVGPQGAEAERLELLARDFEKWLAAQKLAPPPSRSWNWFLQREQKAAAAKWAADYEKARFGRLQAGTLERLEGELRELKREPKAAGK